MRSLSLWERVRVRVAAGRLLLVILCLFTTGILQAQEAPLHRDTIAINRLPPYHVRPFIIPASLTVYVNGAPVDTARYRVDARHGRLWLTPVPDALRDTVVARYRTFPFTFQDVYRSPLVRELQPGDSLFAFDGMTAQRDELQSDSPPSSSLKRDGSITRGIITGNRQDVTLESGLRMHLSGEITDGVVLEAMLTDENTPIQPQGVTQRLSEFDRVFIELQSRRGVARLGDFDLDIDGGTFAPLRRKVQGAAVTGGFAALPGRVVNDVQVQAGAALARGEYQVQEIAPIDGVQGGYRLSGGEGRPFIIIIAGSENVYLDGELLTRGRTNDYTIDYATGDLTFTSDNIITDDRDITVEFQYATASYARTLLASEGRATFWGSDAGDRAWLAATFLQEMDMQPLRGSAFSSEDSLLLYQAGDDRAAASGATPVIYKARAPYVHYSREVQPGPGGGLDTVYTVVRQAPADTVSVYRVNFTHVGPGRGAYRRGEHTVNGLAYSYVGEGLGDYAPVRLLQRPQFKRVLDVRAGVSPLSGVEVFGEWAQSVNDRNRLSPFGDDDDRAMAYRAGVRLDTMALAPGLGSISGVLQRRYTGTAFSSFDRIRPVEFDVRWNLVGRSPEAVRTSANIEEQLDEAELTWAVRPDLQMSGAWGSLRRKGRFEGIRRALEASSTWSALPDMHYDMNYLTSTDHVLELDGYLFGQQARVEEMLFDNQARAYLAIEHEEIRQLALGTDSATATSEAFWMVQPGVEVGGGALAAGASVAYREERFPAQGRLRDAARALTAQTHLRYNGGSRILTSATVGYRRRHFNDYFRREEQREDTGALLVEWNGRSQPLGPAMGINWYYEALTERTPVLQEIYVFAGPELGQYTWRDLDEDGVVEIEEFLPEVTPGEGSYIKSYIPSDTLTPTVAVQVRMDIDLSPGRFFEEEHWLSSVRSHSTIEVVEKSRFPDVWRLYLLDQSRFRNPDHTLRGRLLLQQDVKLFSGEPSYGVDLAYTQLRSLTTLAGGQERQLASRWQATGRYRPGRRWSIELESRYGLDRSGSETFASRRYGIRTLAFEPNVSVQATRSLQLSVSPLLARKRDDVRSLRAQVARLPLAATYSRLQRLTVRARAELSWVRLDGEEAATGFSLYELTGGRGAGTSYLWNVDAQYRFTDHLRASLTYYGRLPDEAPAVHTVQLSMNARL